MDASHDLVIRGGLIIDGSGGEAFEADVAVSGARIEAIGAIRGRGAEEIDAKGKLVTPGFVDIHTHYDGQVTWEHRLKPSSDHGVTTVVMGNCGVGFAPIRRNQHAMAVALMEGVEDIPGVVMTEGLPWNWESFPEYLDALDQRRADIDFATQLPHSPLRVFVMGERGATLEPPTDGDLAEMRRLTAEAVRAGALGVTTSRAFVHRFVDGRPAPSVNTEERELLNLAAGLRDAGAGVFQLIPNLQRDSTEEFGLIRQLHETSGRPVSFTLVQNDNVPGGWRPYVDGVRAAAESGVPIRAQYFPRPVGILFGLDLSMHPFCFNPSYRAIADLPLAEKVKAMRDPEMKRRLLAEEPENQNPFFVYTVLQYQRLYLLGDPPNYTPPAEECLTAKAEAMGVDVRSLIYDSLLEDDGHAILYSPRGVPSGPLRTTNLFGQPGAILGLGDGGAHYGMICDAGWPTYVLTRCARDAPADQPLPINTAIKLLSRDNAIAAGLLDRGLVRAGYKADLNVLDLDRLRLHGPRVTRDLPAAGRRLSQRADGYAATIVSGQVTYREGEPTEALPGRLVRGGRADPR